MIPDVELKQIVKSFGPVSVVNGVSFTVEPGQFFSLLGPSGCGKSTLLRIISGFEQPDGGEIRIAGEDMSNTPPYRRPTGLVFQRWALFPHLSVFENIAFGMRIRRESSSLITKRVTELLELVGLANLGDRKPSQLSGGQQQRVAIARALAIRPKVLLLDEPLSSLDLKLRLQMQIELKKLQQEVGTTFIFVTHDQNEAMTMSDVIAVVNKGRIEQLGAPQDIYDHPATRFVAGFIGDSNLIEAKVEGRESDYVAVTTDGVKVLARCDQSLATVGNTVHVSLRYERIKLGYDVKTANRFSAVVRDVIFSGSAVRYNVQVAASKLELTVEVAHDGVTPLFPKGAEVTIGWDPEAAVVLFE